ncbi:MAG: CinA family protein [Clostridia bacterium]|nr:CinA family protein [Clostridia bacterium]
MKNQTLKLYGLTIEQINAELENLNIDKKQVKTYVKEKYLDAFLYVEQKKDEEVFVKELARIVSNFSKYIYADRDISLYEKLHEVLEIRKKTICLMEQATGGIITSNLLAFDGAEKIVKASYVMPSIKAMIDHFDLNPFKLTANHGVCGEIAFDIASHIRSRIPANFYVVCLSSLAEGNELYYNGNMISYIAIGSELGVKIFKIEANSKKRDFMNQVAKTICFKLINMLK